MLSTARHHEKGISDLPAYARMTDVHHLAKPICARTKGYRIIPRLLGKELLLAVIFSGLIVSGSRANSAEYEWKPLLASFDFSTNSGMTDQTVDLYGGTGAPVKSLTRSISIDPGMSLSISKLRFTFRPTKVAKFATVVDRENRVGLAEPASFPDIRIRATIRKNWGFKDKSEWYDEKDERITGWITPSATNGFKEVQVNWPEWKHEKKWDALRFQIQIRGQTNYEQSSEAQVMLPPVSGRGQWNAGHNIFNTMLAENPKAARSVLSLIAGLVGISGLIFLISFFKTARKPGTVSTGRKGDS